MIEFNDPYWRRILSWAIGGALVLAVVALVAFPMGETMGGGAPYGSGGAGLNVTPVHMSQGSVAADQWWVTVNVTANGRAAAENVTATVKGVTLVDEPSSEGSAGGTVARGGSDTHTITVERPLHLSVSVRGATFSLGGSLSLTLTAPSGKQWSGSGSGTSQSISVDPGGFDEQPDGDYKATVTHTGGFRSISYNLAWNVTHLPASDVEVWNSLSPGQSHEFVWMAKSPSPPKEPVATVTVDATLVDPKGGSSEVHYLAGANQTQEVGSGAGAAAFLTSGEFLGFSAIGILGLSVASGALRTRGGRATSQDRARREVTFHRLAWVAVLAVVAVHGIVQIAAGHLDDTGAVLVGIAAFATLGSLVWFNAYNRKRVLAMEWPKWLRLKLVWVAAALSLIAVHLLLFGRHFVG